MELEKKLNDVDELFRLEYKRYLDLHQALDKLRGKELSDETALQASNLLQQIQEQFIKIYPVINWCAERGPHCLKMKQEYQLFIDSLKLAGIAKDNNDPTQIIH